MKKFKPYIKYAIMILIIAFFVLRIKRGGDSRITQIGQNNFNGNNVEQLSSRFVVSDKYNDTVTDETRKKQTPKPGGSIRVRLPGNPVILNPILSNEATSNMIMSYLFDSLVNRDPETLEYRPWMAQSWEIRDIVQLKNGNQISGKIIQKDNLGVTVLPVTEITFALVDVQTFDVNRQILTLKNGKKYRGKITKNDNTIVIEAFIEGQREQRIGNNEIKLLERKSGNRTTSELAILEKSMFIFNIRKGIEWQDSNPKIPRYLTADDIIFTFRAIMNPYINSQVLRSYFREIDLVKKLDDYTVSFTYSRKYFGAFNICAGIPVLPKHRYRENDFGGDAVSFGKAFNRHDDNRNPIAIGPYKLHKWDVSRSITLTKNNKYWANSANLPYWKPGQPYLDNIIFVIILNNQSALKALEKNEIDADFSIEPSVWVSPETNTEDFRKNFVRATDAGMVYTYIGWNNNSPFFKDHRVRKAMTMLMPLNQILSQIHFNLGSITTGPFYPRSPAFNQNIKPYQYNPQRAGELLDEAGWVDLRGEGIREKDGIKFNFEYLIHNMRDYHQRIADIVKEHVEQVGIKMTIRVLDWSIFLQKVSEQKFDAVRLAWGMSIDPDPYQVFHSSQSEGRGSNYISFKNEEADNILETARETFDEQKRWEMYKKFHQIMHDTQPYTFMFNLNSLIFYNKKFQGVKLYYSSTPYNLNEWYYVGDEIKKEHSETKYNIIGIMLLLLIAGAIYFFAGKIKKVLNNQI